MNQDNKVSDRQIAYLSFFLTKSLFLLFMTNTLFRLSKNEVLIVALLGTVLGLLPLFMYLSIWKKKENLNLFEKINASFSKPISLLFRIFLFVGLIFISVLLTSSIASYIKYSMAKEISLIVISLTFLLLIYYLSYKGSKALFRTGEILFYLFLLLLSISFLGISNYIDIEQVRPFFIEPSSSFFKAIFYYAFFTTSPLLLLLMIPKNQMVDKRKSSWTIIKSYLLSNLLIWIFFFVTISVLGIDLALYYQYPFTILLKKITFLKIIERLEVLLSMHFLFDFILLLGSIFLLLKQGIESIFGLKEEKKKRKALTLVVLFLLFGSIYIPLNLSLYSGIVLVISYILPFFLFIKNIRS